VIEGIAIYMTDEQIDSEHFLWQGTGRVMAGQVHRDMNCRISVDSSGDLQIRAEDQTASTPVLDFLNEKDLRLTIPELAEPARIFCRQASINSAGRAIYTFTPKRSPIWITKSETLRFGRTAIVNFAPYYMGAQHGRFELKGCGWNALFIPMSEQTLAIGKSMQNENYVITHQVEFSRCDGSLFAPIDLHVFLEKLSLFLSFCRGQWVATSSTVAFKADGEVGLEQWGTGRVSSWRDPSSWIDRHHGDAITQLYPLFLEKLEDESWDDAFSHVVYWLTRAEIDNVGPDGGCILLQATLERFAWHLLVRTRKAISEQGFRDLTAADQLRLLLNVLSVPTSIPGGLVELAALGKSRTLDGPGVFTFIRNQLVHPPKLSAKREALPYYEACRLAKWYVELAVLSACGYTGTYSNCTREGRWVGEVERVPWANPVN
jgi:hypothetical protein